MKLTQKLNYNYQYDPQAVIMTGEVLLDSGKQKKVLCFNDHIILHDLMKNTCKIIQLNFETKFEVMKYPVEEGIGQPWGVSFEKDDIS